MDKEVLIEILRFEMGINKELFKEFKKRIKEESFLKHFDERFNYESYMSKTTDFVILKDLTKKMREKHKGFLYAFEMEKKTEYGKTNNFGFVVKSNKEENSYVMFYVLNLKELEKLYYEKDSYLDFLELIFVMDGNDNLYTVKNDIFDTNKMDYFKTKFYYEIFKNDYLDHYLKEKNLRIKNLVTNVFK